MSIFAKLRSALLLFTYDEIGDVTAFYRKFRQPALKMPLVPLDMSRMGERVVFMQEELNEFKIAMDSMDLPLMADALIDLVYVAKGTALELGLPWEDLWSDVQRANMAKVAGTTSRNFASGYDVRKPPGWVGPKTEEILSRHGWSRDRDQMRKYRSNMA